MMSKLDYALFKALDTLSRYGYGKDNAYQTFKRMKKIYEGKIEEYKNFVYFAMVDADHLETFKEGKMNVKEDGSVGIEYDIEFNF